MAYRHATVVVLALVAALMAGEARAQELELPRGRQGYYVGVGLRGLGTLAREDGENQGPWAGNALMFRAGEMLTTKLGVGAALEFGGTKGDGQTAFYLGFVVEGTWNITGNLAATASLGPALLEFATTGLEDEDARRIGGGMYGLGLSYDFFPRRRRLSGGLALTPTIQARVLPGDDRAVIVMAGLDVLWWTGRTRNQLELPPSEAFQK